MADETEVAEKLRAAQEYFRGLRIKGWEETNSPLLGGGQATVLVVIRDDGARGAFRFTTESGAKALERFSREIKILSAYEHPNILKILDYSKDTTQPWYISELGDSFAAHWKRRRRQLADDPEQIVRRATDVIRQLAVGLAPLHDRGIVHRDIKPANIIAKSSNPDTDQPVLIDFGLAYVVSEPRLSDVNETVGNLRFSPDVAMHHMEDVLPWLDVHNLAQLFMWMARARPDKDWQRALDPRWVNYDNRLPADLIHSIRALTALCTEQSVSPKSAWELVTLIDKLFPRELPPASSSINLSKIAEGRRRGMAAAGLAAAENTRIIEASFPIVAKTYVALCEELESLFAECRAVGIRVSKVSDVAIDNFRLRLLETTDNAMDMRLISWEVGGDGGNAFTIRVEGRAVVPSRRRAWMDGSGRLPPEPFNPFYFTLLSFGPQTGRSFPGQGKAILLDNQGSLFLCVTAVGMGEITATSIPKIVEMVKEWVEDPEVWEALQTKPGAVI